MFTPKEENDRMPTFCCFPLRHSVVFLFWTWALKLMIHESWVSTVVWLPTLYSFRKWFPPAMTWNPIKRIRRFVVRGCDPTGCIHNNGWERRLTLRKENVNANCTVFNLSSSLPGFPHLPPPNAIFPTLLLWASMSSDDHNEVPMGHMVFRIGSSSGKRGGLGGSTTPSTTKIYHVRKPHSKSRQGCRSCKAGRVKVRTNQSLAKTMTYS